MLSSQWRWLGWVIAPGPWLFALRLAWEAVVLSVIRGPQMVGFSLAHQHPALALSVVVAAFLGVLWVVLTASWVIYSLAQKRRVDRLCWIEMAVLVVPFGILAAVTAIDVFGSPR